MLSCYVKLLSWQFCPLTRVLFHTVYKLACIFCTSHRCFFQSLYIFAQHRIIHDPLFTQFFTVINFGHPYMMFDSSGHMQSCSVWKSFNQLSSWWLLCKRYAYALIRVSRHYYLIRMFLLCLCIFASNKAFWSWSWSCPLYNMMARTEYTTYSLYKHNMYPVGVPRTKQLHKGIPFFYVIRFSIHEIFTWFINPYSYGMYAWPWGESYESGKKPGYLILLWVNFNMDN